MYRCKHCANELKDDQMVCDYCGQEREGYEHKTYTSDNYTHASSANERTAEDGSSRASYGEDYSDADDKIVDLLPYIRKGREYYARKFHKMKVENKKVSWNIWAFLFGTFWLAYRKMYLWAFATVIIAQFTESLTLSIVMGIAIGVLGNYIYMRSIEKWVVEEKKLPSGQEREAYIDKKAGTSKWAVLGFIVLAIII